METGNPQKDTHWAKHLMGLWLLVALIAVAFRWQNIDFFILADTDDNLRLAQVKAWLGGQAWYDLRQYRLDPPYGADIHWSRIPDLPMAAIMTGLAPFVGWITAQKIAIAVAPLIPFGIALAALSITVRRLVHPHAWLFAGAMLVAAPSAMGMFLPTRIDHHGWQLAFLAVVLAGLADQRRKRGGLVIGLGTALSLSVGLEMLPYLALAGAVVALRWLIDGEEAERLKSYGAALSLGTALGFLAFASEANRMVRCDALSPVWLSTMVLTGALCLALSLLAPHNRALKLVAGTGAAMLVAGFFITAWPSCLSRPEGISDTLYRLWFVNITEVRPLPSGGLNKAVVTLALPVSGLLGAVWMLIADKKRAANWAALGLFSLASIAMLFWQTRAAPAAQLLAVPGAAALAFVVIPKLVAAKRLPLRLVGPPLAFLAISGLLINIMAAHWPSTAAPNSVRAVARTASARCTTLSALKPIAALPPATVFTFVDLSPRLIAMTPHSAIAGPYHRNGKAILDVFRVFRGQPEAARKIIAGHGADYLLICPNMAEGANHKRFAPKGFLAQLEKGQVPTWLTPVPLPEKSPFKLWKVRR